VTPDRPDHDKPLLVVEDDPRLRDLLGSVLCPPGWRPVLTGTGAEALQRLAAGCAPAVAVVDLGLPDMDGVQLIQRLAETRPSLPIVVLTVCTEERRILEAIRAGARGYLFKEDLGRGLAAALDEALAGGAPMSRAVARLVLQQVRRDPEPPASAADRPVLTDRERQVVEQLARGLTYDQVGSVLDISANTVRSYVRAIYEKLCVCSKTEAVLAALRLGLIGAAEA
jgi:DNA-binding NarL/FixJ family response regulator